MPSEWNLPAKEQLARLRVKVSLTREDAAAILGGSFLDRHPLAIEALRVAISDFDYGNRMLVRRVEDEAKAEAKKQATLDADVPLESHGLKCQASVAYPGRWPSFHRCDRNATVKRPAFDDNAIALCGQHRTAASLSRYVSRHG
jgi:hypothetical protein